MPIDYDRSGRAPGDPDDEPPGPRDRRGRGRRVSRRRGAPWHESASATRVILVKPTQPALAVQGQQPTAVSGVSNVPNVAPAVIRSAPQATIPEGMALVSSPRLPLFDLASQDVGALVSGQLPSWIEVGSALDLAVSPVAINGTTMDGLQATDTFADYAALADFLNSSDGIGGVALVPADQVDARVNVLSVDGFDPVRRRRVRRADDPDRFRGRHRPRPQRRHKDARVQRLHASVPPGRRDPQFIRPDHCQPRRRPLG